MIQTVSEMAVTAKVGPNAGSFQVIPIVVGVVSDNLQGDGTVFDWPALAGAIAETFDGKELQTVEFDGKQVPATPETLAMALWEGVETFLQQDRLEGMKRACSSVQVSLGAQTVVFAPSSE